MKGFLAAGAVGLGVILVGCSPAPEEITYGIEECAYCRMIITEPLYAAQVVSRTGRTFKFDSVECMAAFVLRGDLAAEETHSRWVQDLDTPGPWLRVEEAVFLHGGAIRSPMGLSLAAVSGEALEGEAEPGLHGAEVLSWEKVLDLVQRAWTPAEDSR